MKKLHVLFGLIFFVTSYYSQSVCSTFLNNNGNGKVTFNFQNTNSYAVIINDISSVCTSSGLTATEAWYSTTPLNYASAAAVPLLTTAAWTQFGSATISGVGTTGSVPQSFFTGGLSLVVPAGATYAICINSALASASTTGNLKYSSLAVGTYTDSNSGCNILTGTNISYAGGPRAASTSFVNTPRGFIGCVNFVPAVACSGAPNAGLAAISSSLGCPGNAITLSATGLSSGTGISYQWKSSTSATGPWANIAGATTSSYATATTTTTYYQLVTTCSVSALSATSSVVSYSVNNLGACFCGTYPLIYASSSADEEITNVTVGSMNNSSTCTSLAGGLGSLVNLYSNYAGIVTGPTVAQASSVSFSLTQTTCGGAYNNFFQIYVDWNQDGDWLDAGEQVYSQAVDVNGNQTVTGSFAVPITSALGTTRMRVVNIENLASTTNYAHTAYTWGETEDYCITIVAGVNCSGTPNGGLAAISSSVGCPGNAINLSATGLTVASGLSFQWQSATSATGPWANITGAIGTSYATATTTTTYYQLVSTCTISAFSATSSVVSYSVNNPGPCICGTYGSSNATITNDDEIFNVTLGSLNNSSTCSSLAPGLGSMLNKYSNYAGFIASPSLVKTTSYPFAVTVGQCGTFAFSGNVTVYIDYNQNGLFTDAGEMVYLSPYTTFAIGGTLLSTSIIIPATALLGTTRMRVIANESATAATPPTGTYFYGETEDYCITIVAGVNCTGTPNGGLAAITSSVGCPGNAITLSATGLSVASGLSFQWQSATSATGPWANITGATGTSYATATTTTTYYQLVSTCTISALSATSSVVSYSVNNPGPCICVTYGASNATSTADEEIFNVTLGSLNNSSTCSSLAPGSGSTLNKYSNYAGFVASPTIMQTTSYPLAVTVGQCGATAYSGNVTVYIDYNQNGLFTDAGEMVYLSPYTSFAVGGTLLSTSIAVPATALLGTTRMRVIANESATTATPPTGTYSWGETEDYCVTIVGATPCSGTPNTGTISISNTAGCSGGIINLSSTGLSTGSGLTYQWQSATAVAGPWVNIAGATTTSYSTTTVAGSTYYQLVTTCTTSALSNTTNAVSFNGISCGTTLVPASGSNTITCGASTKLYDDGGALGNYSANDNGFTVINNGGSGIITISGTYANIETCCDTLKIFSGAGISGTLLYSYAGSGTMTTFSSTPGQILTVKFYSDPSIQGEGFDINVIYTGASSPTVSIAASSPTVCSGAPLTLTASGADSYVWSTSATTSSVTVTPAGVTVYSVTGTTCASTNTAVYTVTISPSPSITVNSGAVCPGGSFTINPLGGTSYTFSSGSSVVTPTATTTYTVWSASTTGGCLGYTLSTVSISGYPVISVYSGTTCSGSPFTINPSGAVSYTYSGGSAVVSPTVTTTYTITGANLAGCTSTAVCNVAVVPGTPISATANPTLICVGEFAELSASTTATSYTWNTGATTPTISVSPIGNTVFSVSSLGANGCLNFGNVTVLVNPCTSIDELTSSFISVYPNPHTGSVNLELPSELAQHAVLEMYDALGKLMLKQDLTQELNTINMMDLPNGLYTYKVINQSQVVKVGKLVKQ